MTYPLHLQAYPPALKQRVSIMDFAVDESNFDVGHSYNRDIERATSW